MKCLVFSDSHHFSYYMEKAIRSHPDAEIVFFLGDGLSDIDEIHYKFPKIKFLAVKGNCDFRFIAFGGVAYKTEQITLLGKKIVYTHGDLYEAKLGFAGLIALAKSKDADIILFGHTHIPECQYVSEHGKPFYLFNPGSIGARERSFGVLTLEEGKEPLFSHGSFT